MKKRILSLALALVMCLSLLPVPAFAASGQNISIEEKFPDEFFQRDLMDLPGGEDGEFTPQEIQNIKKIKVKWLQVEDLTGIEYFTELEELDIEGANVFALDLRKNTKLTRVNVSNTPLLCADLPANSSKIKWENARGLRTAQVKDLENMSDMPSGFDYHRASNVVGGSFAGGKLERRGAIMAYDYKVTNTITLHSSVEAERGQCSSAIVKFEVSRYGTWADGSRHPIFVELPWNQGGQRATLPKDKVPTGMKPNVGFEGAGWEPEVNTQPNGITEKVTTYTYKFINLPRINVNEYYFGDSEFLEIVKALPGAEDGVLYPDEIAKIKTLDCSNRPVQIMQGIQYLTALESVNIQNTNVFSLNLSENPKIKSLAVGGSPLYAIRLHPDAHVTHWDIEETKPFRRDNHTPVDSLYAFELKNVGRTWGGNFDNGTINFTSPILRYEYTVDGQTFLFSFECGDSLEPTTATLTFVLDPGGVWADGTTGPIYVDVPLHEGRGTLRESQIPRAKDSTTSVAVGWEPEPDTSPEAIRGEATYTYRYHEKRDKATITFRVVNGTWSDGSTADKTVTLRLTDGRGTLSANQIPKGMKPAAGYELGDWNIQPDTTKNAVIHDVTYTYAFAKEQEPTITIGGYVLDDLRQDLDTAAWRWDASENRLYFKKNYRSGPIQATKVKNLNLCRYAGLSEEACWNESSFGWGSSKGITDRYVDVLTGNDNCNYEDLGPRIMRIDSQNRGTYRMEMRPEEGLNIVASLVGSTGAEEPLKLIPGPVGRVELTVRVADPLVGVKFMMRGHHTGDYVLDHAYPLGSISGSTFTNFDASKLISLPGAGSDLNSLVLGEAIRLPHMEKGRAFHISHSADNDNVELVLMRRENGRYVELQTMTKAPEGETYSVPKDGDYYLFWYYHDSYQQLMESHVSASIDHRELDNTPPVDLSRNPKPPKGALWDWNQSTHTLTLKPNFSSYREIQPSFIHDGDLRVVVQGYTYITGGSAGIVVKNGSLTVQMDNNSWLILEGQTDVGLSAERDVTIDGDGHLRYTGRGTAIWAADAIRFIHSPQLELKVAPGSPNTVLESAYGNISIPGTFRLLDEDHDTIYEGTWAKGVERGEIVKKNINANTGMPPAWQIFVKDRGELIPVKGVLRGAQDYESFYYEVSFDAGGAQGTVPATMTATGTALSWEFDVHTPANLYKEGCQFSGWLDERTGKIYRPGDMVTVTMERPTVTLVAQWKKLDVPRVRVDIPEAMSGTAPADFYPYRDAFGDLVVRIPSEPIPEREGYEFNNYWLSAHGKSERVSPGEVIHLDENNRPTEYILSADWTILSGYEIPAPSGFNAYINKEGKPCLTWNTVPDADGYEIQRSDNGGAFQKFYSTKSASGTLRHGSAQVGTTYRYRIRTVRGGRTSDWAMSMTVTACLAQPQITVDINSAGKPVITWEKIPGAVKYDVQRAVDDGPFQHLAYAKGTKLTNGGAKPGTAYVYRVVAVYENPAGNSAPSAPWGIVCELAVPNVKLSNNTSTGKPTLTWEEVDGAVKYQVYRKVGKNGSYEPFFATKGTKMTNGSAKPGTTYYYYVVAISDNGQESGSSDTKYITCDCARPNVTARLKSGKPYLTWGKVSGAIKYEVYRSVDGQGFKLLTTVKGTSLRNGSAKSGQTCKYRVKAICSNKYGNSALSYIDTVKVK